MPRLSNDERKRAVTMLLQGATQQEVVTALGVHQTTVDRLQGRLVPRSKWISNMWTICSDTKLSESIAHSLSTYTVFMCSWRHYGSFYSYSCQYI
jgi:hypothetical protein